MLRSFTSARVQSILLKGASVVRWLYDAADQRAYIDCDLLVPAADAARADEVLSDLGFKPDLHPRDMPAWWQEHAAGWVRHEDGVIVDLHRTVPGVGVDPHRLWAVLSGSVETIEVGGFPARTLTIPGRALHLALHAAQHGVAWTDKLADLERALARADMTTWSAAAELAARVEATAAFAAGLRMIEGGRALAAELGLPTDLPVDVALHAASPPPLALGFEQLASASGMRSRLAIMRHKLAPPPAFMRVWFPPARRGRLGMALAYAWRPLWILLRAPAGLRAWVSARRRARSS